MVHLLQKSGRPIKPPKLHGVFVRSAHGVLFESGWIAGSLIEPQRSQKRRAADSSAAGFIASELIRRKPFECLRHPDDGIGKRTEISGSFASLRFNRI